MAQVDEFRERGKKDAWRMESSGEALLDLQTVEAGLSDVSAQGFSMGGLGSDVPTVTELSMLPRSYLEGTQKMSTVSRAPLRPIPLWVPSFRHSGSCQRWSIIFLESFRRSINS